MSRTLVLLFHPDLKRSRANAALSAAAAEIPGFEIVDMQSVYPDGHIDIGTDGEREAARLLSADRIVLQFPVQWYSTPPLLKAWQDAVLTRMFYILYQQEGRQFEGTPLLVAATAGNTPEAYTPSGQNLIPLADILAPLRATAWRCHLPWAEPFLIYNANKLDDDALVLAGKRYTQHLRRWAELTASSTAQRVWPHFPQLRDRSRDPGSTGAAARP